MNNYECLAQLSPESKSFLGLQLEEVGALAFICSFALIQQTDSSLIETVNTVLHLIDSRISDLSTHPLLSQQELSPILERLESLSSNAAKHNMAAELSETIQNIQKHL